MRRTWVLAATLLLATGCTETAGPVSTGRIRAAWESGGIRLTNLTDDASGYFLHDANSLALIDWTPCVTQEPDCLRLPAKGSVLVPFDQITVGGADSKEVVIYNWWVLQDIEGALHVDMDAPLVLKR